MRNLKKLLALVLAMVMALSLMMTANAAVKYEDYPDKDSITDQFVEGVQVLTGLKVFQGDESGFRPSDTITRAEAAAIIYRMATGDVDDRQTELYSDYSTFSDVKSGAWYAGYVGYCQNAGYIKGKTATTFDPSGNVTGYEALAMILRVVGYGQNNEFTGSSWQVNVAALSRQLGVTKNVTAAHMENTLNMAAPREVVADLIFMTATIVPTVTYTPALAYNDKQAIVGNTTFNITLGQKVFGLFCDNTWTNIDKWGRPGYKWYKGGVDLGTTTTAANGKAYMVTNGHPVFGNSTSSVATIKAVPNYETLTQVRECDVAHALEDDGFGASETFRLYVNGVHNSGTAGAVTDNYNIVATDTVTKVGGQGRITEVYFEIESPWFTGKTMDVVMIDTFLARVTGKSNAVVDKNNHVITPAKLDVTIYDGDKKTPTTPNSSNRTLSKATNSDEDWDEYSVGSYILLYAYTNQNDGTANAHTAALGNLEKAAFETNKVVNHDRAGVLYTAGSSQKVWVLGTPEVKQGKQSVVYWNAGKHNLDGTDYNDQMTLFLDQAGSNTNTTYNWYFDKNNNIIGIGDASTSSYGVITSIYAAVSQGDTDTTGGIKAMASVKYSDGTTGTVAIDKFLMSSDVAAFVSGSTTGIASVVDADGNGNAAMPGNKDTQSNTDLTSAAYTVELIPVYDTNRHGPMTVGDVNPLLTSKPGDAANRGWLYLAPSSGSNNNAHFYTNSNDTYGILYDHMFKFTTASDNSVVAIEVAGATNNTGLYDNHFNRDSAAGNIGMIYKSLGFVTLDTGYASASAMTGVGNPGTGDVYVDDETQIMIRTTNTSISTFEGVSELPGNVVIPANSEVDWADTDNDGRAEYLYIRGEVSGVVTYGLFYYNGYTGEPSIWNGTTGTITGYLNGKAETITFNNKNLFDVVNDADLSYKGHLFALQLTNGVVSSVMAGPNGAELLNDSTTNNKSNAVLNTLPTVTAGSANFQLGTNNGNPYSATTEAVYYRGASVVTTPTTYLSKLVYNRENTTQAGNTITVTTDTGVATYWITPNTNIWGQLEWLNTRTGNDVTIVYDNSSTGAYGQANAILDIYITPDPDVTPGNGTTPVNPLRLESMRVDTSGSGSDLVIYVSCGATTAPAAGDKAVVTLRNTGTGALILNGSNVTNTDIREDTANHTAGTGYYTITVKGAGASLSASANQTYSSTITLTINGVDYTGTFTGHGIL